MKATIVTLMLAMLTLSGCAMKQKSLSEEFAGQSAENIFAEGEQALVKRRYETAIKHFEALDALYPFSPYQQQGQLELMYAYYKTDDYASCAASAVRYIHLYPRSEHVDYAYFMKGMANFSQDRGIMHRYVATDLSKRDLGTTQESFSDFAELVRRYPNSPYAADARERMIYLRNLLAQHELDAATFYYDREMYVAAANRANYVISHFQESPQVLPALGMQVEANMQLGLSEVAKKSMLVLLENYPDSELASKLQEKYWHTS